MELARALPPVEFRFTDPEDVAKYGDRWYRFAEGDVIRRRARDLIELEEQLGMTMIDTLNGMRMRTTLGELAVAWLGVREVDEDLAGEFDEFNPLTMLITWRPWQAPVDEGKDEPAEDTQPPPADTTPAPAGPSDPEISAPTDTVSLPVLPVVE